MSIEDDVKGFASIVTVLDKDTGKPLIAEDVEKSKTFITFDGIKVQDLQAHMIKIYESYKLPDYRKSGRDPIEEPFIPLGMVNLPSHGMGITHDNVTSENKKLGDIVSEAMGGKDVGAMIVETIINYGRFTPKELFEKFFKTIHRDLFLLFINKLFQEDALLYMTEKDEDTGKDIQTLEYITVEERNRRLMKRRVAEKKQAELEDKMSEESISIP